MVSSDHYCNLKHCDVSSTLTQNYLESSLLNDLLQNAHGTPASNMYVGKINMFYFKGASEAACRDEWPPFPHLEDEGVGPGDLWHCLAARMFWAVSQPRNCRLCGKEPRSPTALMMGKDVLADKCSWAPAGRAASLHYPPPRQNLWEEHTSAKVNTYGERKHSENCSRHFWL